MVCGWCPGSFGGSGNQPLFLTNWSRFSDLTIVQLLTVMDKVQTVIESGLDDNFVFGKDRDWLVMRQLIDLALIPDREVTGNASLFANSKDSCQIIHRPEWSMGVTWTAGLHGKPCIMPLQIHFPEETGRGLGVADAS